MLRSGKRLDMLAVASTGYRGALDLLNIVLYEDTSYFGYTQQCAGA